jgi:hypothetical protein
MAQTNKLDTFCLPSRIFKGKAYLGEFLPYSQIFNLSKIDTLSLYYSPTNILMKYLQ